MTKLELETTVSVRSTRVVLDGVSCPGIVEIGADGSVASIRDADRARADADTVDVGDALVVPAPLDLHFHGAGGHLVPPGGAVGEIDATLRRASLEAPWAMHPSKVPLRYEWLATLPVPTTPPAEPIGHVEAAARAIASDATTQCRGIRIEGMFLNPARAGVWPPETFCALDVGLLEELDAAARAGGSQLCIVDIAPEIASAQATARFITRARELGIVISLAHTDATWERACHAIDAGATLATHLWNAMRPLTHREPGVVAASLLDPRVTVELICDSVHLHPATIALSTRCAASWVVVSDASPFAGCPPGAYEWAGGTVTHDGATLRDDAGRLAGAASLMWSARATLERAGIDSLDAALALGAAPRRVLDPARSLGLHVGDPVWIVA